MNTFNKKPKIYASFRTIIFCILMVATVFSPAFTPLQVALAADTNPWSSTGTMSAPRAMFTMVRLLSGKALAIGGVDASGNAIRTTDLYDPTAGAWTASGSLSQSGNRFAFPAALLSDGQVLVAGGVKSGAALKTAELYNPSTGTWATTTGSLPIAMAYSTATTLSNGTVLVAGGANTGTAGLNNAYLYNSSTNAFTSAGTMNSLRRDHTATLLSNGKVLIVGGSATDGSTALASIDLYDPTTGWAAAAGLSSMTYARHSHTATLLLDGRVLVAGGTNNNSTPVSAAEIYDPTTGTWSSAGTMVTPRYFHEAVLLGDGKVLVIGGADASNVLSSAELYDPTAGPTGTWTAVSFSMSTPRMYHSAAMLLNDKVLVAGGTSTGDDLLSSAELYDASNKTNQTISVTSTNPGSVAYNSTFTVAATASSGLPVTYSSGSNGICTVSGAVFTMVSGTGTCIVQFDQGGDATYNPAPRVTQSVAASKINQTINITTDAPPSAPYYTNFTVAATSDSGLTVSYASGNTSVCNVSGAVFTIISGTGTCVVQFNQTGNANYNSAQVIRNVTASKIDQTINIATDAPPSAQYNSTFTVAGTASSGLVVTYTSGSTGVCTVIGAVFTMVSATGTCVVQFNAPGNANYNSLQVIRNVTATKADQTINITSDAPPSAAYNSTFTVAATASSGLTVTYSSGNITICTVSDSVFTMTSGTGTCVVQFNAPGNANYNSAQVSRNVTATKINQTINITSDAPPSAPYNSTFTVAGTASSGLVVSYASGSTSICTVSGPVFTMVSGTGSCEVQFSAAGNANYNDVLVIRNVAATKINQTITITSDAPPSAPYNSTFSVAGTASSNLPVTFTSGSTGICNVSNAVFTMVSGTGTCVVQFNQVGNANYNSAQVIRNVIAEKIDQTINVTSVPTSIPYNGTFTPAATASSGLAVAYTSGSTGVCTVSSALFTMVSGTGTCIVQFDQLGNANYNSAQVVRNVTATKIDQTINVTSVPTSIAYNGTFTPAATASSGLPVTYTSASSGVCTVSSAVFTMLTGTGTCVVQFDQGGNTNYNSVQVTRNVTASKITQTITFSALGDKLSDDPDFSVSATASSNLSVGFNVGASDSCTITGNMIHLTGVGTCTVTAVQTGNNNYLAANPVSRTFTISRNKVHQTITFDLLTGITFDTPDFTVSATASSGLPVTYNVEPGSHCTLSGNIVHITGAGSCIITATQTGNDSYLAADPVTQTFEIAKSIAQLTLNGLDQVYDGTPKPVGVTTTPSGLTVIVNYEGTGGTLYTRSPLAPTEKGTYTVTVEIDDQNYQGTTTTSLTIGDDIKRFFLPLVIK
jgi:hypothetical protein